MSHTLSTTGPTPTVVATLPRGMVWADELDWLATQQTAEYSTTGALLLDAGTRQAGRPITLAAADDAGWITRAALLSLRALDPLATYTLTLSGGATHTVRFAPGGEPITAHPVGRPELPGAATYYVATLRLIEA